MRHDAQIGSFHGGLGLFLLLLATSLLLFRGTLETSDEILMAATTAGIVERFELEFTEPLYGKTASEYGLGTSIAAIPAYLLDRTLRPSITRSGADWTLLPLTNAVLFALLGVLAASVVEGSRRWALVAIVLCASPLLPASLTLYSELLAAVGLLGVVAALDAGAETRTHGRALKVGALAACMAAVLARISILPLLMLALLWGWRRGAPRTCVWAGAAGILLGLAATGMQNLALRGGILATGYAGQDFVTPVLTGLHGLLLSPERGLLVFFPAILAPILCWHVLPEKTRSLTLLAAACTIFSLVFHGNFWTWHGGWTAGPRFMLPCIALFVAPVAAVLAGRAALSPAGRFALGLALVWSAVLAWIYARHSAIAWWNRLWGFHQIENLWLFAPQMSLWQAWFEGVPMPLGRPEIPRTWEVALTSAALVLFCIGIYPVFQGVRQSPAADPTESRAERRRVDSAILMSIALMLLLMMVHALSGPRGWRPVHRGDSGGRPISHLLVDGQDGTYEGILDFPLRGSLRLAIKANAHYVLTVNERVVAEQREDIPQHLNRAEVELAPGLAVIRAVILSKDGATPPLFELYWTWGGEGVFLAPAGGEYLLPRTLTRTEQLFTSIWRRKFQLLAVTLALLLLWMIPTPRKGRESLI